MSHGTFTERNQKPADADVVKALASARPVWQDVIDFLEIECKSKGEFKFYGKNYGWALRFNKAGKSLAALYPSDGGFTVQVILNPAQVEKALQLGLNPVIEHLVRETREIHEGKWIFIRVGPEDRIDDIKSLLLVRAGKS